MSEGFTRLHLPSVRSLTGFGCGQSWHSPRIRTMSGTVIWQQGPGEASPPRALRLQKQQLQHPETVTPLAEDLTPTLVPHPALETHPAFLRAATPTANHGNRGESRQSEQKEKVIKRLFYFFQVVHHEALNHIEEFCGVTHLVRNATRSRAPPAAASHAAHWQAVRSLCTRGLSGMSRPEYLQGLWRSRHLGGLLRPYKARQSGGGWGGGQMHLSVKDRGREEGGLRMEEKEPFSYLAKKLVNSSKTLSSILKSSL